MHAILIRNELLRVAQSKPEATLKKKKKEPAKTSVSELRIDKDGVRSSVTDSAEETSEDIYVSIHYAGDYCALLVALERECGIIGANLIMGEPDHGDVQVKGFRIRHLNITAIIGNIIDPGAGELKGIHVQNANQDVKTINDIETFMHYFKLVYCKLMNRNTLSVYGTNFLQVMTSDARCTALAFGIDLTAEGTIDANKAYTVVLMSFKTLPVFDAGCEFVYCPQDVELEDYTLYVVRIKDGVRYSTAQRLILDRMVCVYYGSVLKRAKQMIDLPFVVEAHCRPRRLVDVDFEKDISDMYHDERMTEKQRKTVVNSVLGCLDKYRSVQQYGEWFLSPEEADAMRYGDMTREHAFIVRPPAADALSTLKLAEPPIRTAIETAIDNDLSQFVTFKANHEQTVRTERQTIYMNLNPADRRQMSEGFLAISQLKYQVSRLAVLKTWLMVERSGTLVPVGVRTDGIYVRRPTEKEKKEFRKRNKLPNQPTLDGWMRPPETA
jgi:hypothetical protein